MADKTTEKEDMLKKNAASRADKIKDIQKANDKLRGKVKDEEQKLEKAITLHAQKMSRMDEDLQDAFADNKTAMERRDRDKNKLERLQVQVK